MLFMESNLSKSFFNAYLSMLHMKATAVDRPIKARSSKLAKSRSAGCDLLTGLVAVFGSEITDRNVSCSLGRLSILLS